MVSAIVLERYAGVCDLCNPSHSIAYVLYVLQRTRRRWILDRQMGYVAEELKEDLGDWVVRQLDRNIPRHEEEAQALVDGCNLSVLELRAEWKTQRSMQTSVRQCTYQILRSSP